MIKAIIFDLDDTLIDFRKSKAILIKKSVKSMIKAGLNEKFKDLHNEFTNFYWECGIEDQHIFEKFFMKKYGKIDYKILAHAIIAYRHAKSPLLKPYRHVVKVLKKLKQKGVKLAVLSDAPRINAHIRLVEARLDNLFDLIITYDDVKELKPSPKGFNLILKTLKVKPNECLMVGDNPPKDIEGAKKVGIKTCLTRYTRNEEIETDYKINDIKELLKIIP